MNSPHDLSRRKFIGSCCAAVGATGMLSALAQLRLIGAVAADSSPADYKALVCLFLYGGNDSNNLLVPTDSSSYAAYAAARSVLALPQAGLLPIAPKTYSDGRQWGLHPSMVEMQQLFNQGRFALMANTGTLVQPVTLAQYKSGAGLPPQLFSHADQQVQWQSSVPDQPFSTGWGGRLADMVNVLNGNSAISMSISVAGQNSFQVGKVVAQYAVSPTGAVVLTGSGGGALANVRYAAQQDLFNLQEQNLFEAAFGGTSSAAVSDSRLLTSILAGTPALNTTFPSTTVGTQMQMIAKLIAAAPALGLKRQVFFASLGGWDLHSDQLAPHAALFAQISQGLSAFYNATVELGVAAQVTTFTSSDFSRTFNTNGSSAATAGSDHGWGSHHMVLGGAVNGGDIYGTVSSLKLGGADDTGRGRWIPSTSVDQYAATLATWFGVSATNLPIVLPNIGRFATASLGFMNGS